MFKNISNFGTVISKSEQKSIQGGHLVFNECTFSADPSTDWCCHLPNGCPDDLNNGGGFYHP